MNANIKAWFKKQWDKEDGMEKWKAGSLSVEDMSGMSDSDLKRRIDFLGKRMEEGEERMFKGLSSIGGDKLGDNLTGKQKFGVGLAVASTLGMLGMIVAGGVSGMQAIPTTVGSIAALMAMPASLIAGMGLLMGEDGGKDADSKLKARVSEGFEAIDSGDYKRGARIFSKIDGIGVGGGVEMKDLATEYLGNLDAVRDVRSVLDGRSGGLARKLAERRAAEMGDDGPDVSRAMKI